MRTPLHGKGPLWERLDLHMHFNNINPKGFRQPPTSRKNPRTHQKGPTTRIEEMANRVK